jgi:HlyD family secretion protein
MSQDMTSGNPETLRSINRSLGLGLGFAGMLTFGLGGWVSTVELASAIISSGTLVVSSSVKKVQHPVGGVVEELRAREGMLVAQGDLLVRLDSTMTRASLMIISRSIDEIIARQARLNAELEDRATIEFPDELLARNDDSRVVDIMNGEAQLFLTRRSARQGLAAQYAERIGQLREQMRGLAEQISAKTREIELINVELRAVRGLWSKSLIHIQRLTAIERESVRLEGERGVLRSTVAQAAGRIAETELQRLQIVEDLRKEVGKELSDLRGRLSELIERKIAADDQLRRTEIYAPQAGSVHQLAVHTIGGVIAPGEAIMMVVPGSDDLIAECRIAPQDIDHVRVGQDATLRFPAFNQRTTPELTGVVGMVSADVTQDQRSGGNFYLVRIKIDASEVRKLGEVRLVPGMPVESFIKTGSRTVLSYLVKPFSDQIAKAWREI